MKKAIIMLVVLFVAPAALADIPTHLVDFHAEWTGTWDVKKNSLGLGEPNWQTDTRLHVGNLPVVVSTKYLWVEIDYTSHQYTFPYPDLVVTPTATLLGVSTCGSLPNVTWLWSIYPQPAEEWIDFPNSSYKALENIYRIEVGTYCTALPFPEPATLSLLALGSLAVLRRRKSRIRRGGS